MVEPHVWLQSILLTTVPHTRSLWHVPKNHNGLYIFPIYSLHLPKNTIKYTVNFAMYLSGQFTWPLVDHAVWIFHLLTPKNIPSPTSLYNTFFSITQTDNLYPHNNHSSFSQSVHTWQIKSVHSGSWKYWYFLQEIQILKQSSIMGWAIVVREEGKELGTATIKFRRAY